MKATQGIIHQIKFSQQRKILDKLINPVRKPGLSETIQANCIFIEVGNGIEVWQDMEIETKFVLMLHNI